MRHFNSLRRNLDTNRLLAFRRNLKPYSTSTTGFRSNPDRKWGPTLYNPLEDDNHAFKDDSHYQRTISKLRRRNPDNGDICPDCGLQRNPEEGTGLFRSLYTRRNPGPINYALREASGVSMVPQGPEGLFTSIFARRNPPTSPQTASGSLVGQGLFKSIFSRKRQNPVNRWNRPRHRRWGSGRFNKSFYGV